MRISILTVGHKLESFEEEWINLFQKRIKPYVSCDWIRLNPKKKISDEDLILEIEKKTLRGSKIVLLDENGKSFSTKEFKDWIDKLEIQSTSHLCFVLGESHGFSEQFLKKHPFHISLSKLTFPHKLALLILSEQLYRVYSWKAGSPYHHE